MEQKTDKKEESAGVGILAGEKGDSQEQQQANEAGLRWIQKRTEYLSNQLIARLDNEPKEKVIKEMCRQYADLENDFKYIKEVAEATASRFAEIVEVFPTLQELDALAELVKSKSADDDFFLTEAQHDRLKNLEKLRSAVFALRK